MELHFLGACREVGKSSFAVYDGDVAVGLDCGMKVHDHNEAPRPAARALDALVISHAHLDHSGALPLQYRNASPPAFATNPTAPLVQLLLEDSEKVAIKRGAQPPFSEKSLRKMASRMVAVPYREPYAFHTRAEFELYDAGHILGSAMVLYRSSGGKRVLYTGDYKLSPTRMHAGADLPKEPLDALVIESTYANKDQPNRAQLETEFCGAVRAALEDNQPAIVASFAVGRTQELLQVLRAHGLYKHPVYVDGMAQRVCALAQDFPSYAKNPEAMNDALAEAQFVADRSERRRIVKNAGIVLTTAGMLDGGPALDYLSLLEKNQLGGKLFLTGYQVEGTNGHRLLTEGKMKLNGKLTKITTPVQHFSFSAHASRNELHETVKRLNPARVYCVHGDEPACLAFETDLKEMGFDARAPESGEKVKI